MAGYFVLVVAVIMAVFCDQTAGRGLAERQEPTINFQSEFYRLTTLVIQEEVKAFRCFAKFFFQDANPPPINLDQAAETTTAAPADTTTTPTPTTTGDTAPPPARSVDARQAPPNPGTGLQFWQVSVLNELLARLDRATSDLRFCETQLQQQQGPK